MVVVAILALVAMVAVPIAGRHIQRIKLQVAVQQYVVALRAARMRAVSLRQPVRVDVEACPANRYAHERLPSGGPAWIEMPPGVQIGPASTPLLIFAADGSLAAPAVTRIESRYADKVERFTVSTLPGGIPGVDSEQVDFPGGAGLECWP